MDSFFYIYQLLESHGVIPNKKDEASRVWSQYTLEQQRQIYRSIQQKLAQGKFVHYNPVIAIRDNAPRAPSMQIISADEYYRRFGTQENLDGWVRTFLPEQQKTIYVKS